MFSKKLLPLVMLTVFSAPLLYSSMAQAREFNVSCSSVEDCMEKGDILIKKRKLSLGLEAYRNAIKLNVENK